MINNYILLYSTVISDKNEIGENILNIVGIVETYIPHSQYNMLVIMCFK